MSGSGIVTVLVLMLGSACCMFSYSASRSDADGLNGFRSPGATAPAVSAEDVRALHRLAARNLRREGLDEAAAWHERMAEGPAGEGASREVFEAVSRDVSPVPASRAASPTVSASPLANSAAEGL